MNVIAPTIHLNGTGGQNLLDQYSEAMRTIQDAIGALPSPHGRDYYVQPVESAHPFRTALELAREQHRGWAATLGGIHRDLEAIGMNVNDQLISHETRATTAASAETAASERKTGEA